MSTQVSDLAAALSARATDRVVISGCSGGGKSSLIAELARRGHSVFEEPGRQVVREQALIGGEGLPWKNLHHFVELTVSRSLYFAIQSLERPGISFFDRCAVDQVSALEASSVEIPEHLCRAVSALRYGRLVFLVPPWPEIYVTDAERRHSFEAAEEAYLHLERAYRRFGYETIILPRTSVAQRADLLLRLLAENRAGGG